MYTLIEGESMAAGEIAPKNQRDICATEPRHKREISAKNWLEENYL
jgi:hypothetical protein